GFDLYQGYFFCKPREVAERGIQVNDMARLQLVAELQRTDVDFGDLQEIVSRDVGLSYNLLRFVNSAFFSLPRRVESLRDALVLHAVLSYERGDFDELGALPAGSSPVELYAQAVEWATQASGGLGTPSGEAEAA